MAIHIRRRFVALVSTTLLITGCNGNSPSDPEQASLTVELGSAVAVKEQREINVTPTITGSATSYFWQQLSGPALQFHSATEQHLRVVTPAIAQDANALLQLTVRGRDGQLATDTKQINIKANLAPSIQATAIELYEKSEQVLPLHAEDSDGDIRELTWRQLTGPTLLLAQTLPQGIKAIVPAVYEAETVSIEFTVTDDDGDSASHIVSYNIEPNWLDFQLSGLVSAQDMAGAQLIAQVGLDTFQSVTDSNSQYQLNIKIDDDEVMDYLLIKAVSIERPGLDLMLAIPSLREADLTKPINITPYSSSVLALASRKNRGVIPQSKLQLVHAESKLNASEVADAAIAIAAYSEQSQVGLPSGFYSLFNSVVDESAYIEFSSALKAQVPEKLRLAEQKLLAQGWGKIDLSAPLQNLVLSSDSLNPFGGLDTWVYQFNPLNNARQANVLMAHESAWTILAGSLQLAADTSAMPLLNISIYATDLALPTEVILQLQAANMTTLPVRILSASERLSRLTAGAKRDLYYVEKKQSIQIEPVIIDGTQLNFAAKDVVKNHYMWASALHQQTLAVESNNLIGLWLAPSFLPAADNESKFAMHHILFDANGSGLNITSGEQFNWSIATDISGNNVVLLNFADNYSVVYSLSQHLEQGYLAHVLIFDDNNILQAATSGLLQKE